MSKEARMPPIVFEQSCQNVLVIPLQLRATREDQPLRRLIMFDENFGFSSLNHARLLEPNFRSLVWSIKYVVVRRILMLFKKVRRDFSSQMITRPVATCIVFSFFILMSRPENGSTCVPNPSSPIAPIIGSSFRRLCS